MQDFAYHRPQSLAEAAKLLAASGDAKLMAGGQTLIPTLKQRLAAPASVIDLSGIAELKGIKSEGQTLVIGAMTTHAEVAQSREVKATIPALAYLAEGIGDRQVRHQGTIGGSLANNDPAADYPAAILALGATIKTNKREIAAADFFKGLFSTALGGDEIILAIRLPKPEKAAYMKFPQPASRYALTGVFLAKTGSGVAIAVTGAGANGVFRASALEAALAKNFTPEAAKAVAIAPASLVSDLHGSAAYRAHLISVLTSRAVQCAA